MTDTHLVDFFQRSRSDKKLTVIEGAQALKHAVRFNAEIQHYITCDIHSLEKLLEELAKDVKTGVLEKVQEVDEQTFAKLSKRPHRTKVMAIAKRRDWHTTDIADEKPVIFLEEPKDLENIGAVIRVAAAADAGAVVISGNIDIWHPAVIRGAAGLHWAIPVFDGCHPEFISGSNEENVEIPDPVRNDRQLIALDPNGKDINKATIPTNSILIFGTERYGISKTLLSKSDQIVRLPMKKGVSSLNLATSVAATLYKM